MIQETSSRRESFQLEGVVQERATEAHRRGHPELSGRCQSMTYALAMRILASLFIPDVELRSPELTVPPADISGAYAWSQRYRATPGAPIKSREAMKRVFKRRHLSQSGQEIATEGRKAPHKSRRGLDSIAHSTLKGI